MNALTDEPTRADRIAAQLKEFRDEANAALSLADKCQGILERMPEDAIPCCCIVLGSLLVYHLNREKAERVMKSLNAGKWNKHITPQQDGTKISYTAHIDGVNVELYGTQAPPSCRIVEEVVEIPAHKETRRRLVCKDGAARTAGEAV